MDEEQICYITAPHKELLAIQAWTKLNNTNLKTNGPKGINHDEENDDNQFISKTET
jgi:hypothetical protein